WRTGGIPGVAVDRRVARRWTLVPGESAVAWKLARLRSDLRAPRRDPLLGARPSRVEGMSRRVEVDHQRRVVRGNRLALPGLAIDLDRDDAFGERSAHQQVIDPHPEV